MRSEVYIDERIYLPELDGLRFVAFILVFIAHHPLFSNIPYFSVLYLNGWVGVDLFFVLSAFLFTKLLIAEYKKTGTISFKKFYIRRIFRIWPIYYLIIGASIVLFIYSRGTIFKDTFIRIIGLCTFSDNIFTSFYGYNPLPFTFPLWTIGYEEQFYVFIPIIILFLVKSSKKVKVISILTIVTLFNLIRILFLLFKVPYPAIYVLPITHFESIIFGIIIGFGGFDPILKKVNPNLILALGLLFFVILSQLPSIEYEISYWQVASYISVGISTALILYSVLNNCFLKGLLSKKMYVFLGKRSYGLYIYHLFGIYTISTVSNLFHIPLNSFISFLSSLILTIIFSIISYKYIESPFLLLKKKFEVISSRPI